MPAPADTPRMAKLQRTHAVDTFECGADALNIFLKRFAMSSQLANASQTYVAEFGAHVAGYYSLAVGQIDHDKAQGRLTKGMARHPVPVMVLARLAINQSWQGKGLGKAMLLDALRRTAQAADIAGIRAVIVHAKDEDAKTFYEHFDFVPLPGEPLVLYLLMKEIKKALGP
jgi:GNAT superfamily N-acetyltransferase